jgi:hypothetical protein
MITLQSITMTPVIYLFICSVFYEMQRKGINVDRHQVNAVIAADGDVCIEVLQTIYTFIQSPNYE